MSRGETIACLLGASFVLWFIGEILNERSLKAKDDHPKLSEVLFAVAVIFFMAGGLVTIPTTFWLHLRMAARIEKECKNESASQTRIFENEILAAKADGIKIGTKDGYQKGYEAGMQKGAEDSTRRFFKQHTEHLQKMRKHALQFMEPLRDTPAFQAVRNYDFIDNPRLYSALEDFISYESPAEIGANIKGGQGIYHTTLYKCTCPDYSYRHQPCKHMYYLAVDMGLLSTLDTCAAEKALMDLSIERNKLKKDKIKATRAITHLEQSRKALTIKPEEDAPPFMLYKNSRLPTISETEDRKKCRNFVSPYEWSTKGRYQIALDEWKHRKKTHPQLGLLFERYVGYCYEAHGYSVRYNGAEQGKEDRGCDLIIQSRDKTKVKIVQCKYWADGKEIHENAVTQLYGSVALFRAMHPDVDASGLLVCSCAVSERAKDAIIHFPILEYVENYPADFLHYPCVKCASGTNGERFYYLPFDKHYDFVVADRYVQTIIEAERAGYRRPIS